MKVFKTLFYTLLAVIILLFATVFVVVTYYEKDVKSYLVEQLNKKLNTKVIVDPADINLTVFSSFPYASLDFKNVKALDAWQKEKVDTLFSAGVISMQFNLLDIFHKNYTIKKIELEQLRLHLKCDREGVDNYHFWKVNTDTVTSSSDFNFSLEKIACSQSEIIYDNKQLNFYLKTTINQAQLKGDFNLSSYSLDVKAKAHIDQLVKDSTRWINNRDVDIATSLQVLNDVYSFEKSAVALEGIKMNLQGSFNNAGPMTQFDLLIKGDDLSVESFLSLMPPAYKKQLSDYESEGVFYAEMQLKGTSQKPKVNVTFGVKDGTIKHTPSGVKLNDVNVVGRFSGAKDLLEVSTFHVKIQDGDLNGHFSLEHLAQPQLNLNVSGRFNLQKLQQFLAIDTIEQMDGDLRLNARFKGNISKAGKIMEDNLHYIESSGEVEFYNASIKLKGSHVKLDSLNGNLLFDNSDMLIDRFSGKVLSSDFILKGYLRNFLPYLLLEKQNLVIDASLQSAKIDLDELLTDRSKERTTDTNYVLKLSPAVDFNLQAHVQTLLFRKFIAKKLTGHVFMRDQKFFADNVNFDAMDGAVVCSGLIDAAVPDRVTLSCDLALNKMNITQVFEQMENFGQNTLTDKNVKGTLTANVSFTAICKPSLDFILNKINTTADITVERGELNGFAPIKALSKFISVNELDHIQFATLHNVIEIKDSKIIIPQMEVKSTALNVSCSGTHSFNSEIDYKFKVSLNELLSKKAKAAKKENNEFGQEEDDGLGKINLFLSMTGTVDNPIIRYDKKSAIAKFKQDLKNEKQTVKSILREEFGWFKKDSTLVKPKDPKKDEKKLLIKFDDDEKDKKAKEPDDDF